MVEKIHPKMKGMNDEKMYINNNLRHPFKTLMQILLEILLG